ncbi:MAG: hypothetical protein FJY66_02265 [Calditrichaeota bacterium]|nr:hypothetical protein [Calditrichota bacterium]
MVLRSSVSGIDRSSTGGFAGLRLPVRAFANVSLGLLSLSIPASTDGLADTRFSIEGFPVVALLSKDRDGIRSSAEETILDLLSLVTPA